MIMLDDITALVFNTDDLRDAVGSDNGVLYVYFGADITLAYGITIYPGKPALIIDGSYEGVTHTFTDMSSSSAADTIGIRSVSDITITIQNITLIGRNFYGIPYVQSGTSYSGVSTLYENVTYVGTQINYNPYGLTRFTDCHITVNNNEAAEANRVEIGGTTIISKTNDANAVFWFRGSSTLMPYLKILSGANVTITTAHYFIYESYAPDLIIEPGASLSVATNSGICYNSAHTIHSFLVDTNASFHFTQATNRGFHSLYLDGVLTVSDGARFYMQADFPNAYRLIRFTGDTGGLYINNPKSFVLYNRGNSSATAFQFASSIPFTLSGGQLNYWEDTKTFPDAGTFEDLPLHKWNRPDYTFFQLQGTANNTATSITYHDFTPEELSGLPPLDELQLAEASVLSIGRIPLTIYSAVITRSVTGATDPYANIKILLMPSYFEDPHTAIANDEGLFSLIPTAPIPFSDHVEVFANTPFLIVSSVMAVQAEDALYIDSAPTHISFPIKPIIRHPHIILPRDSQNTESPVVIVDTRAGRPEWQLWIKITGPLMTDENDVLTDAVVFGLANGDMEIVPTEYMPVHTGRHAESDTLTLKWDADKGVLARITVPIRSGKKYTTRLGWVVTPIGVHPEREHMMQYNPQADTKSRNLST